METELITTAQMYWLTRLSPLGNGLMVITILLLICAVGFLIIGCIMQDDLYNDCTHETGMKFIKISPPMAVIAVVLLLVNCLLPTTREMAAIIIVPRIANSEKVQTVGNQLYDLAVAWMKELRPAKNKEGGGK
jgi:NADH:ubiquinone oxidoreductase subunit 6 (subunit J)